MRRFELQMRDEQWEQLQAVAQRTGDSVAHHIRRMIEVYTPLHNQFLSGAAVIAIKAETTSGAVWLRGF